MVTNRSKVKLLSVTLIFAIRILATEYLWWLLRSASLILVCLFTILLYCISNTFIPVNEDNAHQEKHCYSSYVCIIVGRCPWTAILIKYILSKLTVC